MLLARVAEHGNGQDWLSRRQIISFRGDHLRLLEKSGEQPGISLSRSLLVVFPNPSGVSFGVPFGSKSSEWLGQAANGTRSGTPLLFASLASRGGGIRSDPSSRVQDSLDLTRGVRPFNLLLVRASVGLHLHEENAYLVDRSFVRR